MLQTRESIHSFFAGVWKKVGGLTEKDLGNLGPAALVRLEKEQSDICFSNSKGFFIRGIMTLFFILIENLYAQDIDSMVRSGNSPEDIRVFLWGLSTALAYLSFGGALSTAANTVISALNTERIKRRLR